MNNTTTLALLNLLSKILFLPNQQNDNMRENDEIVYIDTLGDQH